MSTDAWGIDDGWHDVEGAWHTAPADTIEAIRTAMGEPGESPVWVVRPGAVDPLHSPCRLTLEDGDDAGVITALPGDVPMGIHDLEPLDGGPTTALVVSPGRCHLPDGIREWGVTVQVPTARSSTSWGIGDLADVRAIATWVRARGGHLVALSPLHAPTPVEPIAASPYYPSSRRWRSPLLIRVDEAGAPDRTIRHHGKEARRLLDDPIVDRDACWTHQRTALEHLWSRLPDDERAAVDAWRRAQGDELTRWATFCALAEVHGHAWQDWPSGLRHPAAPAVARAADELSERVAFHAWLQQLVEAQLGSVQERGGVRVIQDLAVGVDPGGADAWTWQDLLARDFSVGAPPDEFEPDGQSWGLPPWVPWRLRATGYRPLASLLRAAMVAGGGLRIDHVMGLTRLFWVPEGGDPRDGTYVRFAGHELLEIVALESARAGALVVGEDLGTVEGGLREELHQRAILSTKVVWFEDARRPSSGPRSRSPWRRRTTSRPSPAWSTAPTRRPGCATTSNRSWGLWTSAPSPRWTAWCTSASAPARRRSRSPPSRTCSRWTSARTSPARRRTSVPTGRGRSPSSSTTFLTTRVLPRCWTHWRRAGPLQRMTSSFGSSENHPSGPWCSGVIWPISVLDKPPLWCPPAAGAASA